MGIERTAKMNLAEIIEYNGTDAAVRDRAFIMHRPHGGTVETISYKDFFQRSREYAHLIQQKRREQGMEAGDRFHVGVFMQNIPAFFFILGGCAFTSSTLVGINNAQVGEKLAFDINNVDVNLLFVDHAVQPGTGGTFLDSVLQARQLFGFQRLTDQHIITIHDQDNGEIACIQSELSRYRSFSESFSKIPLDPTHAAVVIFTSGTTGAPKGIEVSWEKMVHVGIHGTRILGYTEKDVGYVCMPVNHSNSLYLNVMPALMNQAGIFLRRKFSVSGFVEDIRISGATIWNCVGDPVQYLLNAFSADGPEPDFRHLPLRTVISTGTNASNRARFTRMFGLDIFTEVYGSTEAGALTAVDETTPPCSVGRLLKDVRILHEKTLAECEPAVLDENGSICNLDACAGEIVVSQSSLGASAFSGYYNLPEESARKLIPINGEVFYRMGDLGAVVEHSGAKYLIFLGRTGDWIRFKGENWAPVDGIRVISRYKGIANAGIIGVPQGTGREDDPMYVIQLNDRHDFKVRDFYDYCRASLAHYMLPRFIRIVEKLPMTETMKLKNSLLKKDFYYRDEALDKNPLDIIYEIKDHVPVEFRTPHYQAEIARFTDPTRQDTLKAFTGNNRLFDFQEA